MSQPLARGLAVVSSVYEWDPDAAAYLNAGNQIDYAATGLYLEDSIARAINEYHFQIPKITPAPIAATQWEAELAGTSINMSGWRTLAAALLPLHPSMPTPTNVNFVQGDYDRVTGVKGDGTTKRLSLNLAANLLPQLDRSHGLWITEPHPRDGQRGYMASDFGPTSADSIITDVSINRWRCLADGTDSTATPLTDFAGVERHDAEGFTRRSNGSNRTIVGAAGTPSATAMGVFGRVTSPESSSRLAFVWHGRAIDLAAMDASLTAYMAALAAALS
jgi:hypothetical protein